MTAKELADRLPRLYHVTEPGVRASILKHGLLSTEAILDLWQIEGKQRAELLQRRRAEAVPLEHPTHGQIILNDQRPLSMKGLSGCLDDGLEPVDWLRILNRKVFFWPNAKQLERLTNARMDRNRERSVLVVDTRSILDAHFEDLYLCPINSGNSMRRPARRGLATFSRASASQTSFALDRISSDARSSASDFCLFE